MKLDEVLAMAGEHELSSFVWGASAVALVNTLLSTEQQIDVTITGNAAFERLRKLPAATLVAILTREVVVEGSSVSLQPSAIEAAKGASMTIHPSKKLSPIAVVVMTVLALIGLALTFSTMRAVERTGTAPDLPALEHVIDTLTELAKDQHSDPTTSPSSP